MGLKLDLQKSKNVLSLALQKHGVTKINPCQVSFQMDVSASFEREHRNGHTETLLARIIPFALLFDKDGVIDMYAFGNGSQACEEANENNYYGYVEKYLPYDTTLGYGTLYLPAFRDLVSNGFNVTEQVTESIVKPQGFIGKFFGKEKIEQKIVQSKESIGKHLSFFITDGEAQDQERAKDWLAQNQAEDHFIFFITIGGNDFKYFTQNYKGKEKSDYFNLTHNQLAELSGKTDEELYEMFCTPSVVNWANKEDLV